MRSRTLRNQSSKSRLLCENQTLTEADKDAVEGLISAAVGSWKKHWPCLHTKYFSFTLSLKIFLLSCWHAAVQTLITCRLSHQNMENGCLVILCLCIKETELFSYQWWTCWTVWTQTPSFNSLAIFFKRSTLWYLLIYISFSWCLKVGRFLTSN